FSCDSLLPVRFQRGLGRHVLDRSQSSGQLHRQTEDDQGVERLVIAQLPLLVGGDLSARASLASEQRLSDGQGADPDDGDGHPADLLKRGVVALGPPRSAATATATSSRTGATRLEPAKR